MGALKGECFSAFVTFWLRERIGIIGLDRISQRGPRTPRIVSEDGHIALAGGGKEDAKDTDTPLLWYRREEIIYFRMWGMVQALCLP